ncbi:MAG: acyl-ACP--UDP-N-acetylglucosamine O-acyltransferase [Phycisphaeraceae bacterium]|nr:acyl-ACP--UDP-N-acetylglucosamine O-acyltransferase [Phycisphaerae bacterium]MBX3392058.1 acyl-ACP--UDP-N-acetylglucosamine O-acyltransferase [Phycisphaeraceae bacterium]
MAIIHPSASVSPQAVLGDEVQIGPRCVVEGEVTIGAGARLIGDVYVVGPARIGEGTTIYPFCCLGFPGQDWKFKPGDPTPGVTVGRDCILREHVTIHAATRPDRPTTVGDRCMLMVNAHLGHDARIGNNVVMVNNSALAGHCELGDSVTLSSSVGVHQFVRVGRFVFMSAGVCVSMDVPPFCVAPETQRLEGINRVGLRRAGFPRDHITAIDEAFRKAFRPGNLSRAQMLEILDTLGAGCPPVEEMAEFVRQSKRGICPGSGRPPRLFAPLLHRIRRGRGIEPVAEAPDHQDPMA